MGLMDSKAGVKFLFESFNLNQSQSPQWGFFFGLYFAFFSSAVKWLLLSVVIDSGVKVTLTRRPNYSLLLLDWCFLGFWKPSDSGGKRVAQPGHLCLKCNDIHPPLPFAQGSSGSHVTPPFGGSGSRPPTSAWRAAVCLWDISCSPRT